MLELLQALIDYQKENDPIELERKWDGRPHWYIYYDRTKNMLDIGIAYNHRDITAVYFSQRRFVKGALKMIQERNLWNIQ